MQVQNHTFEKQYAAQNFWCANMRFLPAKQTKLFKKVHHGNAFLRSLFQNADFLLAQSLYVYITMT